MKIALISAANNVHTMRWANAMSERGHDVTVISCKNHSPNENVKYVNGIKFIILRFSAPLCYYFCAKQVKKLVKKESYDIINVHYASGYGTLARRAKLHNALLNICGSDVYDFPYNSSFNMKVIKKNLIYFRFIASTSHCMALEAKKLVDREYFITPFGVDTDLFKPMEVKGDKDKIIFGTVKTLSHNYGIEDTIKAFIKLVHRLESEGNKISDKLFYEIYGKGEMRESLQNLIDANGMSDRIKLCGYVINSQLPEIINRFTVFNCNSISESFGVAAVEAMACGIPVQVSDADGFAEVVEHGVTGLIAPKGDIDCIAENMYQLLLNKNLREQMSAAAVKRVKQLYDWNKNVDVMEDIYKRMLEESCD